MKRSILLIAAICAATAAFGNEPEQPEAPLHRTMRPHATGKPVSRAIRPWPEGYELVTRIMGGDKRARAKDFVPPDDLREPDAMDDAPATLAVEANLEKCCCSPKR